MYCLYCRFCFRRNGSNEYYFQHIIQKYNNTYKVQIPVITPHVCRHTLPPEQGQPKVEKMGFPIWYWAAPNVVNTFVKQYDFSHKKVVLFATSGGSDMGKTAEKLQPFLGGEAEIVDAKVMNENPSLEALKA